MISTSRQENGLWRVVVDDGIVTTILDDMPDEPTARERGVILAQDEGWEFELSLGDKEIQVFTKEISAGNWAYRVATDKIRITGRTKYVSWEEARDTGSYFGEALLKLNK
ncbi:hypothetical protein JW899_05160 [Candidatus Uhrbacteria bacterium]|nr:hypothetical protein [Candidatus Uhrbacteria bacterium]